jgi:transcriptional regulator with XRE-family HTH domain
MVERIKLIMEYKQLTPAQFAESLGINRSNLTHIFSGRNLPSLEFVRRILTTYPEISTEWLIMNVGNMITSSNDDLDLMNSETTPIKTNQAEAPKMSIQQDLFHESTSGELNIEAKENKIEAIPDSKETEQEAEINSESAQQSVKNAENLQDNRQESPHEKNTANSIQLPSFNKKIEKIIFFYSNKSFDTYYPE